MSKKKGLHWMKKKESLHNADKTKHCYNEYYKLLEMGHGNSINCLRISQNNGRLFGLYHFSYCEPHSTDFQIRRQHRWENVE